MNTESPNRLCSVLISIAVVMSVWSSGRAAGPEPTYCTTQVSQHGVGPCPAGAIPLSAFTNVGFVPDGEICEFVNWPGDPQEYFILEQSRGEDFGAIRAATTLTRGVLVTRDDFPATGNVPGPTGFRDAPCLIDTSRSPTGFNPGRMFGSFNPHAYGGEGAYFFALDISAPGPVGDFGDTLSIAFDVDGDGNRCTQTEPGIGLTSEAPIKTEDLYTLVMDTNRDSIADFRIRIGEQPCVLPCNFVPFGAVAIDPGGVVQIIPDRNGMPVAIQRFVRVEDLTGTLPGTPLEHALMFLDSNDDNVVDYRDFGIDSDIELVVRNARMLPRIQHVACGTFTFLADSFDDVFCGGAEERIALNAVFPVPDIEVTKEARCLGEPDSEFRHELEVTPGSTVEFRVTIQNMGNTPLDVKLTDALSPALPATVDVLEGQCRIVGPCPAGVCGDGPTLCDRFEHALSFPGEFPVTVGRLEPLWRFTPDVRDDQCAFGPGERLVFTFQVVMGPEAGSAEFCDRTPDVTNVVSVSATLAVPIDSILPPFSNSESRNAEEEDCKDQTCCMNRPSCTPIPPICQAGVCYDVECDPTAPPCVPNDNVGDVRDEFQVTVVDDDGEDTLRELVLDGDDLDDNYVTIDILCRSIRLTKEVRETTLDPNAPFFSGDVSLDVPSAPADIEYRFTIVNDGEVDEQVTLSDKNLCTDVEANNLATFVNCPLCVSGNPGHRSILVPAGQTRVESCRIHFNAAGAHPLDEGLRDFTAADDGRPLCAGQPPAMGEQFCHRNCASVSATAANLDLPVGSICRDGPIADDSYATVCHFPCDIEVTKQVRCLNNCDEKNVIGSSKDLLMTTRDSCVEFVVSIHNTSTNLPICRLRIDDVLSDQGTCITFDDHVRFAVDGVDCGMVPPGFNVNGTPFEWNPPVHCNGRAGLAPGQTLTVTFNATIPANAPLSCGPIENEVLIDGASDCRRPQQPGYTCQDEDSAQVDLLEPALSCAGKDWAFQWDSDGDCQPEAPFSPFANSIDLRDKVFPVQLRLRVRAANNGQVPLDVIADDPRLDCVCATPGVTCSPSCEIRYPSHAGVIKTLGVGESAEWLCDIRVDTSEAMRDIDTCDGMTTPLVYHNQATVLGRLVRDDTNICVPEEFNIPGTEQGNVCRASIQVPETCDFSVTKRVKCADDPDAAYAPTVDALAGSRLTYRIQVRNDDPLVKIPRVCLDDTLTCPDWLVAGSVAADIAGVNVALCMTDFEASLETGDRECYTFAACRPTAPWLAPGETLTVRFDVRVPTDFGIVGTDPDCANDIRADAYAEVCVPQGVPDDFCDTATSHADFDVRIPDMNCDKQVGADLDNDGDLEVPYTHDLSLPCDTTLPFTLEYRFTVTNKGETPLLNVQICDQELVADARAAGLVVGPCALCNDAGCDGTGDACAPLPALGAGQMATAVCRIRVPSRTAWEVFAGRDTDGDPNRYANTSAASANVNAAQICDFQADTHVASDACSATVFLAPLCQLQVTKQAQCLENCTGGTTIGNAKDILSAALGACVEFKVNITNTSPNLPICRLRITDTLSDQPAHIAFSGGTRFMVGATSCPVPPAFNVNGNAFDWDPSTCGLPNLGPGQTLAISFRATIPLTADPSVSPTNAVIVNGAPTCPTAAPNFCCQGSADAQVDILQPRLTCTSKEWSYTWDSDGDCEPDEPFSAFASTIDLRDKVFPVQLRLRLRGHNTGQVTLDVVADDAALRNCVNTVPGVDLCPLSTCELGMTKRLAAGQSADWLCDVCVESAESMRDLAACDGVVDLEYHNTARVDGTLVRADTNVCVPPNRTIPGDQTCSATILAPGPCDFDVDKLVKCADDPDSAYAEDIFVLPGGIERFRVRITNTDARTKIPRVCIRDMLSCCPWLVADSIRANIAGIDVTACLAPEFAAALCTGVPECHTFAACRPGAPWIAPGETLTIQFDVQVPLDHPKHVPVDCTNAIGVDAFTEVCQPPTTPDQPCGDAVNRQAEFDALLPDMTCEKEVRADLGNDGSFDTEFDNALNLRCNASFPILLEYRWTVRNEGETPLAGIRLCDPQLRPDALAAGLTIGACQLAANGCADVPPLAPGAAAALTCRVVVPSRAAWLVFSGTDNDGDRDCYTNDSTADAAVDAGDICSLGAEPDLPQSPCSASVCLAPVCQIDVTKQVRCLDDCTSAMPVGEFRDEVPAVAGSCLEFKATVTNTHSTDPLCRLQICDTLSRQPGDVTFAGNVRFMVGAVSCPVPAAFNVNGTCFDWNPNDCGLNGLEPGQSLMILYRAQIPSGANPDVNPTNTIVVNGAPTCKGGGAQFCCTDTADAGIDLVRTGLRCEGKQWAYQWDSDGDCEPEAPFSPFVQHLDLRDKIFPIRLRLRIRASNTGQTSVDAVADDPTLFTCATQTPGVTIVDPLNCELGRHKTIPAGQSADWLCDIRVDKAEAMRALADCDGTPDGVYTNKAVVSGDVLAGSNFACVPGNPMIAADNSNCMATVRAPEPCEFSLVKSVVCTNGCRTGAPTGTPTATLETIPGALARFAFRVTNTDPLVKIPRLCIIDLLKCSDWLCPGSTVQATLSGQDVSADFQAFAADGQRRCFTFGSRPAAPWIAPGETLIVSFDVQVPPDFAMLGQVPDCVNNVTVEAFTEVCAPPECEGCVTAHASAAIDVQVPRLRCDKTVAVDLGNDGSIEIGATANISLSNPSFPLRLIYTLGARNAGDLPLTQVTICDDGLVADARAAGINMLNCGLCNDPGCGGTGDDCRIVGSLGPSATTSLTCQLVVADQSQWDAFAARDVLDGRRDCYVNRVRATGTAAGRCAPPGFNGSVSSDACDATICMTIVQRCPVTKANVDVWNENERRFSGTERCIISWDQELLSRYTPNGIGNNFLRSVLQTNSGKARIDGIASTNVCGTSSVNAPLIGVAAKFLNFGRNGVDWSGRSLVGSGEESGVIIYEPVPGLALKSSSAKIIKPIEPLSGAAPGPTLAVESGRPRMEISKKGSLLVYPKVEIKWDAMGRPIQDTFISLVNDQQDDVLVQLYFVNGDQATEPVFFPGTDDIRERAHLGCNWVDNLLELTADQPVYWSALTGDPVGLSPFTILDPGDPQGRPDPDPRNPGGRVLRGYILAWAVNPDSQEIRWNHLSGEGLVINYADTSAWDYRPWAAQALTGVANGSLLDTPFGRLDLNGVEYDSLPARLLLDFFASGAVLSSGGASSAVVDTDLTLWVGIKDLRNR